MTYQSTPDLVTTSLGDDEMVLLHLTTHRYYALNETGQFIWQLLVDGTSSEAVVDAVLKRWAADRGDVEAYVATLIAELQSEDLLVAVPSAEQRE